MSPTNQESKKDPVRVVIVDDDEYYREIVGDELSWHGFAVRGFADGDSLLGSLDAVAEADVIVLDWRLPTISGIDLLPQLRQRGVNLPVVFLTGHTQPANTKLAFERGALDFIDKTRGMEVLASRLRLVTEPGRPAVANPGSSPSRESASLRSLTKSEWDSVASQFSDLSYPQCGSFVEVAARDVGASREFIAIYQGPALIGLAAIRLKRIPLSPIGVAYVSRGPMISLRGQFSEQRMDACLAGLKRRYVDEMRLVLRIDPPLLGGLADAAIASCFKRAGFRGAPSFTRYQTFLLDLSRSMADLRKNLHPKWRGHLGKAERSGLVVTRNCDLADLERFQPMLLHLERKKGFKSSRDTAFFRRAHASAARYERFFVHLAWHEGEVVAGHIGSFAGDTAVYLLGATTKRGRELCASYLLQWRVIEHAKSNGNRFYDLGGYDDIANPGVYEFKSRLNGRQVITAGAFEVAPNRFVTSIVKFLEFLRRRSFVEVILSVFRRT